MIYRILMALNDRSLGENIACRWQKQGTQAVAEIYSDTGALLTDEKLFYADAVVIDAALSGCRAAVRLLLSGPMKYKLIVCGRIDEALQELTMRYGVPVCGGFDADALCEMMAAFMGVAPSSASRAEEIRGLLSAVGVSTKLKGSRYLEMALEAALKDPRLIDNVKRGLYHVIAEECQDSEENVERAIRYTVEKCWQSMNSRQRTRLLPRCHHRPGNKLFVSQMVHKLENVPRDDDDLFEDKDKC